MNLKFCNCRYCKRGSNQKRYQRMICAKKKAGRRITRQALKNGNPSPATAISIPYTS